MNYKNIYYIGSFLIFISICIHLGLKIEYSLYNFYFSPSGYYKLIILISDSVFFGFFFCLAFLYGYYIIYQFYKYNEVK